MEPHLSPPSSGEQLIEHIAEAPAIALEEGVEKLASAKRSIFSKRPIKFAENYWNTLGPGLITGASDDDPSGIATYSQAGAQYGTHLLWLSWFTFPLMAVVQEMCARIGIVTRKGLAENIRRTYSPRALYVVTLLLFAANTFNIGADLGAMAQAMRLIIPGASAFLFVLLFAVASLGLQIFTTYARYARYLKYLAFVLLAYVFSALLAHLDWRATFTGLVFPSLSFSKNELYLICAILGTTISPYLFFWQSSQEVEDRILRSEQVDQAKHHLSIPLALRRMRADVWSGMFFSNIVMFFIIAACAGTLYTHGITNISSAADAAIALRPIAGNLAYALFAVGIIGTGLLAIPVLAGSTAYAVSESLGWAHGLHLKLNEAYAFYGVIIISMIGGVLMNVTGIDPIKALIYSAIGNAVIAPVILYFILHISSNKHLMRDHENSRLQNLIGWVTMWVMTIAGLAVVYSLF